MNRTHFSTRLDQLAASSNLRHLPPHTHDLEVVDLTSNDYLGIARRVDWQQQFIDSLRPQDFPLTSSASRLLASHQKGYADFEALLSTLYPGRCALTFNSGYHANSGVIAALAAKRTLIVADRLVHASIIDGIMLSKAPFKRFPHNDYGRLEAILEAEARDYESVLVVVESVYSMDGDTADIDALIDIKRHYDNVLLYVDEAHALGCNGPGGLGLVAGSKAPAEVDVVMATLGKAAASQGAFILTSAVIRDYLVNTARSFIFSTALPPVNMAWSTFVMQRLPGMDAERARLRYLARRLSEAIAATGAPQPPVSQIQPLIVGDAAATLALSAQLLERGVKVLPIRTPTVPPGTERLRFSLSASLTNAELDAACRAIGYISINKY